LALACAIACDIEGQGTMPTHPVNADIHLLDGRFYAGDAHRHFDWMRAHAPLYWDDASQLWGVSRHADVMQLSKRPDVFCNGGSSRPDAPPIPSMINLDDPAHRQRRALVSKGFTPRRVADHEPGIRRVCGELIERAAARGRFDFVREIAAPLPMIVIGDLLGVARADHDRLLRWSEDMLGGLSATAPPEAHAAATRAFAEYSDYHREVVADRRARPLQDDLMSALVYAEIDGERLDDDALLQESLLILIGGDETTRHVISGGMYELLRHPDQQRRLRAEPRRIPGAVEEMLRWVTPIQTMNRTATRDVTLHGETIRAGEKVLLLYPAANRDERVFAEPHRFDVGREPNPHVAFGGYGAHFCLGASLARLELRVMFEELMSRLPNLELASAEVPRRRASNFIVGLEELPVLVR
jgi:cytochrome P450 family 142 subfamily A polypeptide 1